ncbi:MAG: hypothetical protein AAF488_20090, partial [Planctomycetota bacterium]
MTSKSLIDRIINELDWEAVSELLEEGEELEVSAFVTVRGALGRRIVSKSFPVLLDARSPEIEVGGDVEISAGRLWVLGNSVWVRASEPLDVRECSLNGVLRAESGSVSEATQLVFTLPRDWRSKQSGLEFRMVDLAGNEARRSWSSEEVSWIDIPRIVAPREVFLNSDTGEFSFEVEGDTPGRVEIVIGDGDGVALDVQSSSRYRVPVRLPKSEAAGETSLRCLVRAWSELSSTLDRPADSQREVVVRSFARKLDIVEATPGGRRTLPSFEVADLRTGVPIPHRAFDWDITLLFDDGKREDTVSGASIDGESGRLLADLDGSRGKCFLHLQVRDRYGNVRSEFFRFDHGVAKPLVSFALADEV